MGLVSVAKADAGANAASIPPMLQVNGGFDGFRNCGADRAGIGGVRLDGDGFAATRLDVLHHNGRGFGALALSVTMMVFLSCC